MNALYYLTFSLSFVCSLVSSFRLKSALAFRSSSLRISASSDVIVWDTSLVPSSYPDVADLMAFSVAEAIDSARSSSTKLLSIDVLTPGLNPKLEQKAMLMQEYLFDLVSSIISVTEKVGFRSVPLMFPSAGDAAGFQKYCSQVRFPIPDHVRLTDIGLDRVSPSDDCVVFITAKNNVGDPVIREVQKITADDPDRICLFLNCDLTDRVTSGISDRAVRDAYRSTITPAFYFRNIVQIVRPSLVPIELGAILYRPSTKWEILAIDENQIVGPGSLNRYMKIPVFAKDPQDPSVFNPPRFTVAERFDRQPKRDEIDSAMSRIAFKIAKAERDAERAAAGGGGGGRKGGGLSGAKEGALVEIYIDSVAGAVRILDQAASGGEKDVDASVIAKAIAFLETKSTLAALSSIADSSSSSRSSKTTSNSLSSVSGVSKTPRKIVRNDNSPSGSLLALGQDSPATMGVFDINSGDSPTTATTVPGERSSAERTDRVRTDASTAVSSASSTTRKEESKEDDNEDDETNNKWSNMWFAMLRKLTAEVGSDSAWESMCSLSVRTTSAGTAEMQYSSKEILRFRPTDTRSSSSSSSDFTSSSGAVEKVSGLFGVQSSSGRYSASILNRENSSKSSFPSTIEVTCAFTESKMFGFLGGGGGGNESSSLKLQLLAVGDRIALFKIENSNAEDGQYQLWKRSD